MRIYLDNASTTRTDSQVVEAMLPFLTDMYGNPSSIHGHGREIKVAIEKVRRQVADLLHTSPAEIFFTSGGTESDNTAIRQSISALGLAHAITSPIEHHAVLHTLQALEKIGQIKLSLVRLDEKGHVDYSHLEELLKNSPRSLVSLMHGNNEIGNITDIKRVGEICGLYSAVFHSDTVQTVGHLPIDLEQTNVHFIAASAHKFHGPKGVGALYIKSTHNNVGPLIYGGGQERNMRGGTENVAGIVGLGKALELAYSNLGQDKQHILDIKKYAIEQCKLKLPNVVFNGDCDNLENSLYTILNVGIPEAEDNEMLLFNLDIDGVSVSGGSACSSGTNIGSHVLNAIGLGAKTAAIRMSFSKHTTKGEIDFAIGKLANI